MFWAMFEKVITRFPLVKNKNKLSSNVFRRGQKDNSFTWQVNVNCLAKLLGCLANFYSEAEYC